jgi:microcystin-dependent protein
VQSYVGATAPTGWLLCDGTAVSRTTYLDLFNLVGTTYGVGDGSTTFNTPNMKGRAIVGYDPSQAEFDTMGETGGEKAHALSVAEMPSHSHTGTAAGGGSHSHNTTTWGFSYGTTAGTVAVTRHSSASAQYTYSMASDTEANHTHTVTTVAQGSGTAHNVLQPYIALNYIIKT